MQSFIQTGLILRKMRERAGLTQAELGNACEIHSQFVSNWERGICMPPKHALKDLARTLKLTNKDRVELRGAVFADAVETARNNYKDMI